MTDLLILICLGHRIRRYEVHFWAYFETTVRQILREASKELDAVFGAMMDGKGKCKKTAIKDRANSARVIWGSNQIGGH